MPGLALGTTGIAVTVNGQSIGRITKPGRQECAYSLPAAVLGANSVARLELAVNVWKPSELQAPSLDTRTLGVSVRHVEVTRAGADGAAASPASLSMAPDWEALKPLTRSFGRGTTIHLQGRADDVKLIAGVLPTGADGRIDGRFATQTGNGTLWFDAEQAVLWQAEH